MRKFLKNEDGVGTVTMLFFIAFMLMLSSIAIDYTSAVRTQSRLQSFADAAALSGALRLPGTANAVADAMDIAARNGNLQGEGRMLHENDIEFGRWSMISRTFTPDHNRPNALRLTARRDASAGNSLPTILMRLVGVDQLNMTATSLAVRVVRLCGGTGFFSQQTVTVSNTNHFSDGFCLHGDLGVSLGNGNRFDQGHPRSTISMTDLRTFSEGLNNVGSIDALLEYTHRFTIPGTIQSTIDSMRAGDFSILPDHIIHGPVFLNSINQNTNLVPGTLYVVSGNVNLGSNRTQRDVAIVATRDISIGSNTFSDRLVLATEGNISFNTNNWIGSPIENNVCSDGIYTTYMFAMGNISMNSNSNIRAVMMGAIGSITLGNNNGLIDGVAAEALGPIQYGNADKSTACELELETEMDEIRPAGRGGSNLVQ